MANKTKEIETFPFSPWTVEVHRRLFRRTISVSLSPQRPIKVVTGKLVSQRTIYEFLLSKKEWIEKNFQRFAELAEKFPERKIRSSQTFPFLGQELPLRLSVTLLEKPFAALQGEEIHLHFPRKIWTKDVLTQEHPGMLRVLREFYQREGIRELTARVETWAAQMRLFPKDLKFREQKTRWGSCSSSGVIHLNWRLIAFKSEIIDYVIVHELAHLAHMNHSPLFWSLVERHCPGYQLCRRELRELQSLCEFLSPAK